MDTRTLSAQQAKRTRANRTPESVFTAIRELSQMGCLHIMLARAVRISLTPGLHCATWSGANRVLVAARGAVEARGRKAWERDGRAISPSAVPLHIVVAERDSKRQTGATHYVIHTVYTNHDVTPSPQIPELSSITISLDELAKRFNIRAFRFLPRTWRAYRVCYAAARMVAGRDGADTRLAAAALAMLCGVQVRQPAHTVLWWETERLHGVSAWYDLVNSAERIVIATLATMAMQ